MPWSKEKHREYRSHGDGKAKKAAADKAYFRANKAQILARALTRPPAEGAPSHRVCTGCKEEKSLTEEFFSYNPYAKFKMRSSCRTCESKKSLEGQVLKRYGMTLAEAQDLRAKGCSICGSSIRPHIDHDHKTGKVRGVLCNKCNVGLGMFEEDPARMIDAIVYLEKHYETV